MKWVPLTESGTTRGLTGASGRSTTAQARSDIESAGCGVGVLGGGGGGDF